MQSDSPSQQGLNIIIEAEISNKALYQKKYKGVIWPGLSSGATIGIGYDLGFATQKTLVSDWGDKLSGLQIGILKKFVGLKGQIANKQIKNNEEEIKLIDISFQTAIKVFKTKTLPKTIDITRKWLPGLQVSYPYTFWAMVSCVYNRGTSIKSPSRLQMKNIYEAVVGQKEIQVSLPAYIAEQLRIMKKYWPNYGGLIKRREKQAQLAQKDIT